MTPTNMMATNPSAQYSTMPQFPYSMPGQVPSPSPGRSAPHTPMVSQLPVHAGFGNPPTPVHHQQLQSPTTQQFPGKPLTSSISAPSNNHSWSNQQITNTIPASPKSSFFPQTTMTPTNLKSSPMEVDLKQPQEATVPSRGYCIDPLKCKIKDFDSQYICRDPSVKVTPDLFLLGCVFYIFEYEEVLSDLTVIDLWKKMIGKFGGAVEKIYTSSCTHVICLSCTTPLFRQALMEGKRCVSIYWLNDVLQLRQLIAPWLALHLPTHFSHKLKPATNHTISYTGFHSKERERLKQMAYVCGAKFTGFLSKNNTVLICKNSNSLKYTKAREWSVACVSLRWLRDLLQNDSGPIDLQQPIYQKFNDDFESGFLLDLNKSRGLLEPWRIPVKVTMECLSKSQVKRKLIPLLPSPAVAKRPKQDETFEALPRVCFTGFTSMVTQDLTKKLESLNVKVVSTLSLCTHLVAWNISRTVKFLCCISSCSYVVTPQWVEDSFRKGCLMGKKGIGCLIHKQKQS
uniref:PAX-interacting protein 1 n=1 Tax=Ciona savignyi TaxID=51511 RepID=H2ZEB9_CIOSA